MKRQKVTVKNKLTSEMLNGVTDAFVIDLTGDSKRIGVSLSEATTDMNSGRISSVSTVDLVSGVKAIAHPFDRFMLALATIQETYHRRCIKKIAQAVVSSFEIKRSDGKEAEPIITDEIRSFLNNENGTESGLSILRALVEDYEGIGDCYWEIIRDTKGKPIAHNHLPAAEMYVLPGDINGRSVVKGYAQKAGEAVATFKKLNDTIFTDLADKTEVISLKQYSSLHAWYGIPSAVAHWQAICKRVLISEYNQVLFLNEGVPKFMVLLKGTWSPEAKRTVQSYLTNVFKGQHHKTLAIPLPEGCAVEIVYLIKDDRDASFLKLDTQSRDEIIHSHGVPPQLVGIVETGALGGNAGAEQNRSFKDDTSTKQTLFESMPNAVINSYDRWRGYEVKFPPFSIDDEKKNAEIDKIYLDAGVLTPAQVAGYRFGKKDEELLDEQSIPLPLLGLMKSNGITKRN